MDNKQKGTIMDSNNLCEEIYLYNLEYKKAIKKLLEMEDVNEVLSPVTALIMQYLENYLKAILQDCFEIKQSAKDLHIIGHGCRDWLNNVKVKYEKYLSMNFVSNQFTKIEQCLDYLEGIYGEKTLINARYPIDREILTINRKTHTIISDEYKLMYIFLRSAVEHLLEFYELEKIYQTIVKTKLPKEELHKFIDYCDKEYETPKKEIKKCIIKEIDKCNDNVLGE